MTKYVVRIIFFIALLAVAVSAPAWLSVGLVVLYSLIYSGPEVILIGLAMDAYFGYDSSFWYRYTILCGAIVLAATVLRPYLSVYNRR